MEIWPEWPLDEGVPGEGVAWGQPPSGEGQGAGPHGPPTGSARGAGRPSDTGTGEGDGEQPAVGIHAAVGPDRLQYVRTPKIDIIVEGVPIEAVADTGAGPALIVSKKIAYKILHSRHEPRDTARMITRVGQSIALTNCDGEEVVLAGQAMVEIEYAGVTIITPTYVDFRERGRRRDGFDRLFCDVAVRLSIDQSQR